MTYTDFAELVMEKGKEMRDRGELPPDATIQDVVERLTTLAEDLGDEEAANVLRQLRAALARPEDDGMEDVPEKSRRVPLRERAPGLNSLSAGTATPQSRNGEDIKDLVAELFGAGFKPREAGPPRSDPETRQFAERTRRAMRRAGLEG